MDKLSTQARNSLSLYKNGNPETIKFLLKKQNSSVVKELKQFVNAIDDNDLAFKLSTGLY